jgi:hypothetical protein
MLLSTSQYISDSTGSLKKFHQLYAKMYDTILINTNWAKLTHFVLKIASEMRGYIYISPAATATQQPQHSSSHSPAAHKLNNSMSPTMTALQQLQQPSSHGSPAATAAKQPQHSSSHNIPAATGAQQPHQPNSSHCGPSAQ